MLQFIGLEANTAIAYLPKYLQAFSCVMSFCEAENKRGFMRTVPLFISAKLKENYRPAGVYFFPEVIEFLISERS
jgi:hypothetical protein